MNTQINRHYSISITARAMGRSSLLPAFLKYGKVKTRRHSLRCGECGRFMSGDQSTTVMGYNGAFHIDCAPDEVIGDGNF